ncbi:MAG: FtsW/RodA/SpoVE family cell cycle protein [Bacilli bacterium]
MKERKYIIVITIILCLFGIVMIYSASNVWALYKFGNSFKYVIHQTLYFVLGIILLKIISNINYKLYKEKANIILGICFLLLLLVLIPFIGTVRNGSRSWFGIGPFGVQPSELSKIGLVIFTSYYLSKNNKNKKETKGYVLPILAVIMVFFFIIMLEPDFGSGAVIVFSLLMLIIVTGTPLGIFIKLGIAGLIGITGIVLVAPYRLKRITSFINPWNDPLGSGFQIIQSLYALGPGELL